MTLNQPEDLSEREWYLLQIISAKEATAKEALEKQGFEVYLPFRLADSGKLPLYPGYLFIYLATGVCGDDFHPVKVTPSVIRFVTFGCYNNQYVYAIASVKLIFAMRERENDEGVYDTGEAYKAGDTIRARSGMFQDYVGEVTGIDQTDNRIIAMLEGKIEVKFKKSEIELEVK